MSHLQPPVILSLLAVTLRTITQRCSFMQTAGPPWVSVLIYFIKSGVKIEAVHCVGILPPPNVRSGSNTSIVEQFVPM